MAEIPNKLEGEIFKVFDTYFETDKYYVSNFGRVYSMKSNKYLSTKPYKSGYVYIKFVDNSSKEMRKSLHEIIAITFLGPRNNQSIDHIDQNSSNNNLDNLRYVSVSENLINRTKPTNIYCGKPIIRINIEDESISEIYPSVTEASKKLNIPRSNIYSYCKKEKIYQGCQYKYHVEENKDEIWKRITINNDSIEASNLGRIRRKSGSIVLGTKTKTYYRITINNKMFQVHRIICEAFHGKPQNDNYVVNHKDENPKNNHIDNLEWISQSKNTRHSVCKIVQQFSIDGKLLKEFETVKEAAVETLIKAKKISEECCGVKKSSGSYVWKYKEKEKDKDKKYSGKPVLQFGLDGKFINRFHNGAEAKRITGISSQGICKVCQGKQSHAGNFLWKYET